MRKSHFYNFFLLATLPYFNKQHLSALNLIHGASLYQLQSQHPAPTLKPGQEEQGPWHCTTRLAAPAKSHFYTLEGLQALKVFAASLVWEDNQGLQLPPLA